MFTGLLGPQRPLLPAPHPLSSLTAGQMQRIQQRTLRPSGMAEPQKRKGMGPWLTVSRRAAHWPGTPAETLYEWEISFCCVWHYLLKQLAYQVIILPTVLWAGLGTFRSLSDKQSHVRWACDFGQSESCWWACDFGLAPLSPSFLGVPARAMGLLRADFWFCRWSFPWSLITVWFLLLLTFFPARSGEWFFPQVTRAFAQALDI